MTTITPPVLDIDPFSDDVLLDPHHHYEVLREAGAVVRLSAYDIWAMARYREVQAALDDWETFCSGRGAGLSDFAKEPPWRPPSLLLEADPPLHDRTRGVVRRILTPGNLKDLRPEWQARAEALVDHLVARREFDGIRDLAEAYPLSVFPDAVGLVREGRENLLPYGALAFNAFGPRNDRTERALAAAAPVVAWVTANCKRAALRPDGLGARIFEAVDAGQVTEDEAERLVRSFLTAGVDTTVNGIGNMLHAFACHPEQWQALRDEPELVRYALDEALRYNGTVQTFFRTTTRAVTVSGVTIPEGEKVLLFLAAANRDPRQWPDADSFDIRRRPTKHVGFGFGIHACVGQMVARLEAELVLAALAARVTRIELAGQPLPRLNNTLHALEALPLRVTPA